MRSRGSVVKYAREDFLYILVENDLGRKISSVHEAISIVESNKFDMVGADRAGLLKALQIESLSKEFQVGSERKKKDTIKKQPEKPHYETKGGEESGGKIMIGDITLVVVVLLVICNRTYK